MKQITSLMVKSLLTIFVGTTLPASYLHAQTDQVLTFKIPFTFTVSTQRIPPGSYRFNLDPGQFLLSVVNAKTREERIFTVRPEQQRGFESHGRLVFHDTDGGRTLSEIHFVGSDRFAEVIEPHTGGSTTARSPMKGKSVSVAQR